MFQGKKRCLEDSKINFVFDLNLTDSEGFKCALLK